MVPELLVAPVGIPSRPRLGLADEGRRGKPELLVLFDEPLLEWEHGVGPGLPFIVRDL